MPETVLESYLGGLLDAATAGRNLVGEKYDHMMEHTYLAEYACIQEFFL